MSANDLTQLATEEQRQALLATLHTMGTLLAQLRDPTNLDEYRLMQDINASLYAMRVFAAAHDAGYACRLVQRIVVTDDIGRAWHQRKPHVWESPRGERIRVEEYDTHLTLEELGA